MTNTSDNTVSTTNILKMLAFIIPVGGILVGVGGQIRANELQDADIEKVMSQASNNAQKIAVIKNDIQYIKEALKKQASASAKADERQEQLMERILYQLRKDG